MQKGVIIKVNPFLMYRKNEIWFLYILIQYFSSIVYFTVNKARVKQFIKIIEKAETITEFDVNSFLKLIEKMTVFEGEKIIVSLLDGTDIEVVIE